MKSIPFFGGRYPVKTVYTDNSDWQGHAGWHTADVRQSVMQDYLQISLRHVFNANEMDSNGVLAITEENFATLSGIAKEDVFEQIGGYDAMVTSVPNVMLYICTADCLPLYLYDTRNHIAGIAYCGWRGICSGVVSSTVDAMGGVRSEGIYDTGICSFESQDYPSYRRSGHLDAARQRFLASYCVMGR